MVAVILVVVVAGGDDDGGNEANETAERNEGGEAGGGTEGIPSVPTFPEGDPSGGGGGGGGSTDNTAPDGTQLPEGTHYDENAPGAIAVDPDENGNTPEDVATNFYEGVGTGDCELVLGSVSPEALSSYFGVSSVDEAMEQCESSPPADVSLEGTEFIGFFLEPADELAADGMEPNTAVVGVTLGGEEQEMWLRYEEGEWRAY